MNTKADLFRGVLANFWPAFPDAKPDKSQRYNLYHMYVAIFCIEWEVHSFTLFQLMMRLGINTSYSNRIPLHAIISILRNLPAKPIERVSQD